MFVMEQQMLYILMTWFTFKYASFWPLIDIDRKMQKKNKKKKKE